MQESDSNWVYVVSLGSGVPKHKEIAPDVHTSIPEVPRGKILNHVIYRLGKSFRPDPDGMTGRIFRSARRWCMLATLFTCKTLLGAANESKRREREAKKFTP